MSSTSITASGVLKALQTIGSQAASARVHAAHLRGRRKAFRAGRANGPRFAILVGRGGVRRRSTVSAASAGKRQRPRQNARCAIWRTSFCGSMPSASWSRGHAFPPDAPWQHEFEDAFPYDLTVDQASAIEDVKTDMETRRADGPADHRRCRLRQDRGRDACGIQGRDGRQTGRDPDADDGARIPAF